MRASTVRKYAELEKRAIDRLRENDFFKKLDLLSNDQLKNYLLQRFFMSKNFVPWYSLAESKLTDQNSRKLLSGIIDEELGSSDASKSHFNLLIMDLFKIGITADQIKFAIPSKTTTDTIKIFLSLVEPFQKDQDTTGLPTKPVKKKPDEQEVRLTDILILISLRVAGEILVSEEYGFVLPELERRFGLKTKDSVFFYPHFIHDDRETGNHSVRFMKNILKLSAGITDLVPFETVINRAAEAKMNFFNQRF